MEAEAHFDTIVGHPLVEFDMAPVFFEFFAQGYGTDDFEESHDRQVAKLLRLSGDDQSRLLTFRQIVDHRILIFPNQKKSVSYVFIGRPAELVDDAMRNVRNLVHKHHHLFLKNLSRVRKITNIAESEYSHLLLPRQHRIHLSSHCHISRYYLRPRLSESQGQKSSYLYYHSFQNICLVSLLPIGKYIQNSKLIYI